MPIKISGFDPDAGEKSEPERPTRQSRSSQSSSVRSDPGPPPREVRKPVDPKTAEHLRIRYGIQNVKFSELAPKKATAAQRTNKSGSSYRVSGPRLSLEPDKPGEVNQSDLNQGGDEPAQAEPVAPVAPLPDDD